jgi:hypothetical protein
MTSNQGASTFDRGFLNVSVPFKVGILSCMVMDVVPSYQEALGDVSSGCLSLVFLWCDGLSGAGGISEVVPIGSWSLLATGQVAIELYDLSLFSSLPDIPRWSNMFLISPGSSWVAPLTLWLWQVSHSPNKLGSLLPPVKSAF